MKYLDITTPDINNGLGFRVTLWVSGCNHRCFQCHNKESWDFNSGHYFGTHAHNDIVEKMKPNYIKGLTLSGGDPMCQTNADLLQLENLIKEIKSKYPTKDIWIYSGYRYEELMKNPNKKSLLQLCDVLVDGKYIAEQRDIRLPFRGSTNQRVIDIKHSTPSKIKEITFENYEYRRNNSKTK